jgi:hypothetical protein
VNNDGSLTLDATSLDSVLNSDYSGVVGFFQNANSWGQTFSNMLTEPAQRRARAFWRWLPVQQQYRIDAECRYIEREHAYFRAADRA